MSSCVSFCPIWLLSLGGHLFSEEEIGGWGVLGGVGEIVVRVYWMREEYTFNKEKEIRKEKERKERS